MATTLEIVRGISQVLANSYDGALDDKGEAKPDEKELEAGFKTFIDQGGWGGKAKNDTRKE